MPQLAFNFQAKTDVSLIFWRLEMAATDFFNSRRRSGLDLGRRTDAIHTFSGTSMNAVFFLFKSVLGMMFFVAAIGMWFLPGAMSNPDMQVMQMVMTILFLALGFVLFRGQSPQQAPELHINLGRRTVEVAVQDLTGTPLTIASYQMDELSDLAVLGTTVVATDLGGNRVINLDLANRRAANELRDFLTDHPLLATRANVFVD